MQIDIQEDPLIQVNKEEERGEYEAGLKNNFAVAY
jgi:hypothetical protein